MEGVVIGLEMGTFVGLCVVDIAVVVGLVMVETGVVGLVVVGVVVNSFPSKHKFLQKSARKKGIVIHGSNNLNPLVLELPTRGQATP